MNPLLNKLEPYPFEKLKALKKGLKPPSHLSHIALSIGEPKHTPPECVKTALVNHLDGIGNYPATKGIDALRQAIARWTTERFQLKPHSLQAEHHILPVNGTREALFAFVQACVGKKTDHNTPKVVMPNPFYQIYEGATLLAGAEPVFLNCDQSHSFIPDFSKVDAKIWQDCALLFICTPGNPSGAVMNIEQLQALIHLADQYNFIIASDECYSELYFDASNPPPGLLQACSAMGRDDFKNCVVFHSLSKRSNLPGLRSGFVAGEKKVIQAFFKYRTYHGCAMSLFSQHASIAAWQDEQHVIENRELYNKKFDAFIEILAEDIVIEKPAASFYIWLKTPINDEVFCAELFAKYNITALPGRYLARESSIDINENPGKNRVRLALVAPYDECIEAAKRIKQFIQNL